MVKIYIATGSLLCVIYAYACSTGWGIFDFAALAHTRPRGASLYHK